MGNNNIDNINKVKWVCRYAPSLGELEDTPENVWGTEVVKNPFPNEPCVWFGLYGLPDFYSIWKHKGRKAVLWAGTDILHFTDGYWLDQIGEFRLDPKVMAKWLNKYCENYVENEVEKKKLQLIGIESIVIPSFLADVRKYEVEYTQSKRPKLYTSVSGDNFLQYGWGKIRKLAEENPGIEFHLYGNRAPYPDYGLLNIFIHGRVSKEQMNEEIKQMQGALRLTEFDGFSEIIAKSLLWGQWPVSIIRYPETISLENISTIKVKPFPNHKGREWVLSEVNKYPWNQK